MTTTQRFGLKRVGGAAGGALSDDGAQFSNADRVAIDKILAAYEAHDHSGGTRLGNPTAAPTVELMTSGGILPPGRTFYYRVSYVDKYGLESRASNEVAISTPDPVARPGAPVLTPGTGGTLAQDTYYYAVTAEAGDYETQLGPLSAFTLTGTNNAITVEIPALPSGADGFGIWRQASGEDGLTKVATGVVTDWLDDGSVPADPCACDPDKLPPETNRTNATNAVTVTVPVADQTLLTSDLARRWRIYRTSVSGDYGASSLVAEVVDLDTNGDLVVVARDTGTALLPGIPLEVSRTLTPSIAVGGGPGGAGGHLFLEDSAGETWRVLASHNGRLETRPTGWPTGEGPDGAVVLTDPTADPWRLTVETDGTLTTTQAEAELGDRAFGLGEAPHIPTADGTMSWRLVVDSDGVLSTQGDADEGGGELIRLRELLTEPATPASGGWLFVQGGELKFKGSAGTVTTLAPA